MDRNLRGKQKSSKRAAALEDMRKAREGNLRTDLYEVQEEGDVYDLVDEKEYVKLVQQRRNAEDFVVDDENLGYHDDGEEHLGVADDEAQARKRVQQFAEESIADSKTLKKARKFQSSQVEGMSDNQNSILNFVHKSKSMGAGGAKSLSGHQPKGNASYLHTIITLPAGASFDIDGLLNNLAPHKTTSQRAPPIKIAPHTYTRPVHTFMPSFDTFEHNEDMGGGDDMSPVEEMTSEVIEQESSEVVSQNIASEVSSTPTADETAKLSLTHTSKKFKPRAVVENAPHIPMAPPIADMDEITNNDNCLNTTPLSSTIDPTWFIRQKEFESGAVEDYVPFFWLDATESQGVIYLYGRVAVDEPGGQRKYVSSCCIVNGNQRNLFVLPKSKNVFKNDNSLLRSSMADVYGEINSLLVPSVIPRSEGQGFRCKSVRRKYAFDTPNIPREETEYMKVVYGAKYGVPECNYEKLEHIERIFGLTSSPLEHFLLKRKLMGPSWLYIKRPRIPSHSVSWCRTEFIVDNPKLISKIPSHEAPPAPQLAVMSLSLKTIVNTVTHTHEIVMASGVVHQRLDIECDTEVNAIAMKKFTLVRQLGTSCGNMYPSTFPHDLAAELQKNGNNTVMTFPNERALLSMLFNKLHQEDPDVIVSHNLFGFELELLMSRATTLKLPYWNKVGRLRISRVPKNIADAAGGRLLCDTYTSSKEFLRETTYSLTALSHSQLGYERQDIDPIDVPRYFSSSQDILRLAMHTANDSYLVLRLMLKLQIVPLTKQLTGLSGNLWCRTLKGARAERIEFLLLHEFHAMKYVLPEKKLQDKKHFVKEDMDDEQNGSRKVGGVARSRAKASYAGGLVLEPKKGLYDTFILLLDFNSLYPSIIQEYNLCFTTIDWTKFNGDQQKVEIDEDGEEGDNIGSSSLPPVPEPSSSQGVLPRVIKTLVDRRREVKNLLKKARDSSTKQQLDIRQKALKLTANSMYGCLGFSFSRFYARPIAALVTAKGREALQRTVDQATTQMGLDVIYGDTDSVMINTNSTDLDQVKLIGNQVKREVNKLYKSLELDIDGIFKSMLLLKKKKYAALCVKEGDNGSIEYEKEMKGLDLVRRDWCPVSKEAGRFVVDRLLSGGSREDIVQEIHEYLSALAADMRGMNLDLSKYVITKGLNKSPKDYPDCKGQPHLQVALKMLKENKPVNIGDHIPYVICKDSSTEDTLSPAERAHHPDEVVRSDGKLVVDVEWYLSQQILPPISRLCDPIEGTSAAIISQHLGLDSSKYINKSRNADDVDDEWGFTPKCLIDDSERFKECLPLRLLCSSCDETNTFPGVFGKDGFSSGLYCVHCGSAFWGRRNAADSYCYVSNAVTQLVRQCEKRYYECYLVCDDATCGRRTLQQSVMGYACTENCHGRMIQEYDDQSLHTQLKYCESLFDVARAVNKRDLKSELISAFPDDHKKVMSLLKQHMENSIRVSGYNWVRPSLWTTFFRGPSGK